MAGKAGSKVNWPEIYRLRRNQLRRKFGNGVILWMGHVLQPRNYAGETYPFRQNSHFLYYTGFPIRKWPCCLSPRRITTSCLQGRKTLMTSCGADRGRRRPISRATPGSKKWKISVAWSITPEPAGSRDKDSLSATVPVFLAFSESPNS